MLRADIVALEHRQEDLENEISEALCRAAIDDPMIIDLRSRFYLSGKKLIVFVMRPFFSTIERYGFS